ncbi:MAG: von Willebrand factor type (vWA) protein [Ramlibacter sp.]|nr:von Willebrand factor type (vWA) protein [Ramlibacter sp.]
MRTSLLYERLEAPLTPLERLPRGLWLWSLVHSQGRLVPRLAGIESLRSALLEGDAAASAQWQPAPLAEQVSQTLRAAGLPHHCKGEPALTETVLRSLCFHLDMIVDYRDRGDTREEAATRALEAFAADWKDRCDTMDELSAVFGEYSDLVKNSRWDMMRGLLRSGGWQEVVRARRLIEALPELARIVRQLGRARETDEPDESNRSDVRVMEEHLAMREVVRIVHVPDYPGETLGVRRSGRVARMLPAEAMLLLHPRLRLVWHARHAERTLLSYQDDDRMPDVKHELAQAWRPSTRRVSNKRREMGPMLVCVDTSGSMQGGAEAVAKAVVLEAVRTAHAQKRACYLFAFSGPEEIVETELTVDCDGIDRLAGFMGQTFRGGTDISGPLERALDKLSESNWQLADLLIASDGEFGATPAVAAQIRRAKEQSGLRIQGVLIGDRETIGFLQIADDIYWMRDWRRYGDRNRQGRRRRTRSPEAMTANAPWTLHTNSSACSNASPTARRYPGSARCTCRRPRWRMRRPVSSVPSNSRTDRSA